MKTMKTFLFVFVLLPVAVYGQGEFSLYNLHRTVPQAQQLNPAFAPGAKVVVGLPVLSSTRLNLDAGPLSFNNIFTATSEDILSVDFDKVAGQLKNRNNLSVNADVQLFFLGLNFGRNHFSLGVNERVNSWMVYSKDLAQLAIYGNGDERTFGRDIVLDDLFLNQNMYHEIALGYGRDISDKLSVGARIKVLFGVLNAQTEDLGGYFRTDNDSIHITNSSFALRYAGHGLFEEDADPLSMVQNTLPFSNKNTGLAADIGVHYRITNRMSVSASVLDLGYINWKEDTRSYEFDNVTYSFKGFDLLDMVSNSDPDNDFIDNELDSLENLFTPGETEGIAYRSSLVTNFYTGFDFALADRHHVGANVFGRVANGSVTPEFGAYYNLEIGRIVNAVVNGSFRNGKLSSVGAGLSVNLGPVQIYGTTETVMAHFNPKAASMVDARVGINLTFGRKSKEKNKPLSEATVTDEPEEEAVELTVNSEDQPDDAQSNTMAPQPAASNAVASTEQEEQVWESLEESREETVRQGSHEDEFQLGHYIVVGAFESRDNAVRYSNLLRGNGYDNEYGFLTEKEYYYVTVYKNSGDIEEARKVRNEFRSKGLFQFADAWLLSVVE
jgi:hypothetical protein